MTVARVYIVEDNPATRRQLVDAVKHDLRLELSITSGPEGTSVHVGFPLP